MAEQAKEQFRHIVRISNTDINGSKQIMYALNNVKGVGIIFSNAVLSVTNIDKAKRAGNLTDQELAKIEEAIKNPSKFNIPSWMFNRKRDPETSENKHLILADLDFTTSNDIKMMKKIKTYKGVRHIMGLPVRGQKTRSNFRKNKGHALGVKKPKKGGKT